LLIEAKDKYQISSTIVVFDDLAHNAIKKNVVINDAINYIGVELFITKGEKRKALRRIYILYSLLKLIIGFVKGDKIIHFGHLNKWHLKFIALLFRKNTYQMQGTAYGFQYSKINREAKKLVLPEPVGKNIIISAKSIKDTAFSSVGMGKRIFFFGETRTRRSWVGYVNNRSDYYFKKYHSNVDVSKGFVVFILGTLHGYEHKYNLFKSTIKALSDLNSSIPILIKPHTFTEMDTVNESIKDLDSFHITYLHPSLLASKASVFISNNFSNTLADAHSYGVKTIEYTYYNFEKLKITKGGSTDPKFVDYFIQNDVNEFKRLIGNILSLEYTQSSFKGYVRNDNGLFESLTD